MLCLPNSSGPSRSVANTSVLLALDRPMSYSWAVNNMYVPVSLVEEVQRVGAIVDVVHAIIIANGHTEEAACSRWNPCVVQQL